MSLIVFEGIDACGKNTVADAVAQHIGADRLDFPERTSLTGQAIDSYLKRGWGVGRLGSLALSLDPALSALANQALFLANRLEQFGRLEAASRRARSAPPWTDLVLARYWPSGVVYGQLDGLPKEWIERVNAPFPQPDVCVLLDVSAETSMARRAKRDGVTIAPERYEGKLESVRKIVGLYRELWSEPRRGWYVVDAEQPLQSVVQRAIELAQYG